ncbi:NAD(P)/FAD-dependent oxidoreductase [Fibrella aquatilis]|uniref:FAD-dependent oxidoreductase n=1 Tax=Fibrella aquatilis TaxID=2817059 RepID=A0A939G1F2_9BACT|nr:FAD-dependent oxidoreductase [Fibrella aquatilis]MBO0929473.1 FAD-dependent oxidoreductase [Fibrella aquatilis]
MPTILLIGAGLSGLTAARELTRQGHTVTVLDKGRGVGGRLATRRLGNGRADHGAQYFSAQSPDFQSLTQKMAQAGIVHEWHLEQSDPADFKHPRWVGSEGMNGMAKYLARGLDVRTGCTVTRITTNETGWTITASEADNTLTFSADVLIITIPAPQALALCAASGLVLTEADKAALMAIEYAPCMAVMLQLDRPSQLPKPGGLKQTDGDDQHSPVAWLADNEQKGISPNQTTITLHASHAFSQQHLDDPDQQALIPLLIADVTRYVPQDAIVDRQIHRWRYSNAIKRHPDPFLAAQAHAPLLFGGDGFGNGNVEGAFLSGLAMGRESNVQ